MNEGDVGVCILCVCAWAEESFRRKIGMVFFRVGPVTTNIISKNEACSGLVGFLRFLYLFACLKRERGGGEEHRKRKDTTREAKRARSLG
jgi:hypothetical protein